MTVLVNLPKHLIHLIMDSAKIHCLQVSGSVKVYALESPKGVYGIKEARVVRRHGSNVSNGCTARVKW